MMQNYKNADSNENFHTETAGSARETPWFIGGSVSRFTQIFTAAQLLFVLLLPAFLMEELYAFFHAKYESYLQNV